MCQLQWGRDLSVTETRDYAGLRRSTWLASMGPRPLSHGNYWTKRYLAQDGDASMGPRPLSHGNLKVLWKSALIHSLQWGRDLSVTETTHPVWQASVPRCFNGPRPLSHGNGGNLSLQGYGALASMGPRPLSHGKLQGSAATSSHASQLQWGRDLSVTETGVDAVMKWMMTALQWGRDLSVTETRNSGGKGSTTIRLQWGRDLSVTETTSSLPRLIALRQASMGPRPLSHGNHEGVRGLGDEVRASMGPRPLSHGKLAAGGAEGILALRFNGAATSQSRKLDRC